MADWMLDPEVVAARLDFSDRHSEWVSVRPLDDDYSAADLSPIQQVAYSRRRLADSSYVKARDAALRRSRMSDSPGLGRTDSLAQP